VIRGTLLVIPIENSLIYIQPLYLRAEDGRIPELKRVIVGYQNSIAMGVDLEDALSQIFGSEAAPRARGPRSTSAQQAAGAAPAAAQAAPAPGADTPMKRAVRHYRALNDAAKAGDWGQFGRELDALGKSLEEASKAQK
jgi:uncharacterized protein